MGHLFGFEGGRIRQEADRTNTQQKEYSYVAVFGCGDRYSLEILIVWWRPQIYFFLIRGLF